MMSLLSLIAGFVLDFILGDPPGCPHIVVGMGRMVRVTEAGLRGVFPKTPKGELWAGGILAVFLPVFSFSVTWGILHLCTQVHPFLGFVTESLLCWQCLALRSLRDSSMKVYGALEQGDLQAARIAVGQIVGRDTHRLDGAGVMRAAVETVAENTSDGVIAPMLYLFLGGAPLGVMYKAVNTMDSMVGYKNEEYLYFGRAAARLDDAANFIPSRLTGLLTVFSSYLLKIDGRNAWRVFRRDRYNHKSPNSAQSEAAYAGALHVRLGGDAYYFGKLVHKPTLGDEDRPIEARDILLADRLLYLSSIIFLLLCSLLKGLVLWI